jgi:hypothetical protein
MLRKFITPLLAASALAMTVTPAYAGREDRAREAIAAAEAKLHTAESLGAATAMPEDTAQARAALAMAREHYKSDHNAQAIEAAVRASSIADTVVGRIEQGKQQAIAGEQASASMASQQAAVAQQDAAAANARAEAAERSAASSAADASAARSALATQQAAQVETTVTTQTPAKATTPRTKTTVKRTTARRAITPASGQVTTTTTVTQKPAP